MGAGTTPAWWAQSALDFGSQATQGILGMAMGQHIAKQNDKRQISMQQKLQDMQMQGNKEMLDYGKMKDYEMWMKTGYPAQLEQMKKAGLSPGLMYGTGGPGGTTTGGSGMGISGGNAPSGGGEVMGMASQAMQLGLLRAQKENIEADTENKKADLPVKGANTKDLTASAEAKGLANALTAWLQGTDKEGNNANMHESVRAQKEIQELNKIETETKFKIDENERQRIMNNKVIQEITQKIELMAKQGLSQDQITENLKKEGQLKQAEIEWNAMDIKGGNFGKFITNFLKMLVKPR